MQAIVSSRRVVLTARLLLLGPCGAAVLGTLEDARAHCWGGQAAEAAGTFANAIHLLWRTACSLALTQQARLAGADDVPHSWGAQYASSSPGSS